MKEGDLLHAREKLISFACKIQHAQNRDSATADLEFGSKHEVHHVMP